MSIFFLEPIERREQFPFWEFSYTLGGVDVTMRLHYVDRLERWYADLFDANGDTIWANRAINAGYDLAARNLSARLPEGFFWIESENGDLINPTFEDLGRRVIISFMTPDEFEPEPLTDAVAIVAVP